MAVQSAKSWLAFLLAALLCLSFAPLQYCFADEEEPEPEPEPEPEVVLVSVPNVSNMTREQAEKTLRDAGFSVSFSSENNEDMEKDTTAVRYTDPGSGSEVEPGSTITVYIYVGTKEKKKDDEGDDEGDGGDEGDGDDSGDEGDDSGDEGDEGDDSGDEGDDSGDEGDGDDEGDDPEDEGDDPAPSGNDKPEKPSKPNKPEKNKPEKERRHQKPARTHTVVRAHKINNATWGYYKGERHVRTEPIAGNLPYSVTHKSEDAQASTPANMAAYEISKARENDPAEQESSRMVLSIVTALCIAALVLGFLYRMTMHSLLMKGDESAARKRRALLKGRR